MDSTSREESQRPGEDKPRRPVRGISDLTALFEEVDRSNAPAPHSTQITTDDTPSLAPLRAPGRLKGIPDLSILEDAPAPSQSKAPEESAQANLSLPSNLESFISPDLWRKLNCPAPPRGVLVNALDRVRSVFNLLSTFLPSHLVQEKMRHPVPGLVNGQMLTGTLLFSDVSGFTALSERLEVLGPQGAERLTEIMNRYFTRMLEILSWSGGILLKFAGDATLVYFPQQANDGQAGWAVRAGQRMLNAIADFSNIETPSGKVSLKMKIGIGTGQFLAASAGSPGRMEYIILGPAVTQTMGAEGAAAAAGQLLVNAATVPCLPSDLAVRAHKNGYSLVEAGSHQVLDDFEIKAEARRPRGAMPWSASPDEILTQIEETLRQIKAILPYLSPELAQRLAFHGQRSLFASQFRLTTVLFCNVWGPEALLSEWGSEGVMRITGLLSAYFNAMNDCVSHYGGIISRIDPYSKGSKLLILFGAPVAHEDDPERAISTALSMNVELENLNETLRRKLEHHLPPGFSGPLIQHRIGITNGDTFAGQVGSPTRREYTVMGDEVNLSARLMSAADPGQILIHLKGDVFENVSASFRLSALQPIRVKGKSKPIPIYQVEGPRDDLLAGRAHKRGKIIGREAELARALGIMQRALAGKAATLTITGPAGIGKSHLADELILRVENLGARSLSNQCRSYTASSPYASWSALLRSMAGITSTDYQPQVHHHKLQRLITELSLAAKTLSPLATLMGLKTIHLTPEKPAGIDRRPMTEAAEADLAGDETGALISQVRGGRTRRRTSQLDVWDQLDEARTSETGQVWQPIPANLPERERNEIYQAVLDLLRANTQSAPLVIFFEDAHWMDPQSRELLRFISTRAAELPLLLLLAQREGDEKPDLRTTQVITLTPLDSGKTTELVAHLLVSDLAQVIHEQSNGNPLLIEEITHWFQRTRNLNADDLRSVLQTSNFMQKLVLSELESLPEEQREIAMSASVIGTEFRTGEVQSLLPSTIDPVTLSNHLRALSRTRLVSLMEAGADARYTFQQSLVRDILYNSLPYEKRRELHAKLAEYLIQPASRRRKLHARLSAVLDSRPSDPLQETETIAHHYELAESYPAAAQYFMQAGDQARQQKENDTAAAFYTRALDVLQKAPTCPENANLKARLLLMQGDLALLSGEYLAAASAYDAAKGLVDENSDLALKLTHRLGLVLPTQKRAEEGALNLRAALTASPQVYNLENLAVMAWLSWRAGKADAQQWIEACKASMPPADDPWTSRLLAAFFYWQGNFEQAKEASQSIGWDEGAAWAALRAGDERISQEEYPEAAAFYNLVIESQIGSGLNPSRAFAYYRMAEISWRAGEVEKTVEALEQASAALNHIQPAYAAFGMTAIRQARKVTSRAKAKNWPVWSLQSYEDHFWIQVLLRADVI